MSIDKLARSFSMAMCVILTVFVLGTAAVCVIGVLYQAAIYVGIASIPIIVGFGLIWWACHMYLDKRDKEDSN